VLFTSAHLYQATETHDLGDANSEDSSQQYRGHASTFYPGTGSIEENTPSDVNIYPGGILNVPITPGQATGSNWRKEFTEKILPRVYEFKPDLILVSAGFDAH
jgi:acetoin utilization deacetylase AcuC-like enzyme